MGGLRRDLTRQRGSEAALAGVGEHRDGRPFRGTGRRERSDGRREAGWDHQRAVDLARVELVLGLGQAQLAPVRLAARGVRRDGGGDLRTQVLPLPRRRLAPVLVDQGDGQVAQFRMGVDDAAHVEQRQQQGEQSRQDRGDQPQLGAAHQGRGSGFGGDGRGHRSP